MIPCLSPLAPEDVMGLDGLRLLAALAHPMPMIVKEPLSALLRCFHAIHTTRIETRRQAALREQAS